MQGTVTYLLFDGNCRDAMTFYAQSLGGEVTMSKFSEGPPCPDSSVDPGDRIMHARIVKDGVPVLMASDIGPGMPFTQGNNFSVSVNCTSTEETDRIFNSLSEKGTVTMAPQDMFWGGYFGMLKDQFGIHWMLNYEKAPAKVQGA